MGIARALIQRPKIILADEPCSSLDPKSTADILDFLQKINQEDNITVICNLHVPELAEKYAKRIVGISQGQMVFDGTPEEVYTDFTGVHLNPAGNEIVAAGILELIEAQEPVELAEGLPPDSV